MARVKLNHRNVRKKKTKKLSIFLIAILVIAVVLASLYFVYGNSLFGFLTGKVVAATQPAIAPGATSISVEKIPKENCYEVTDAKDLTKKYIVRALPGTTEAAFYDSIITAKSTVNAEIPVLPISSSLTVAKCLPTTTGSTTYSPEVTASPTSVDEVYRLGSIDLDLDFRKLSTPPGDSGTTSIKYSTEIIRSTDPKKNGKITFSLSVNFDSTDSKGNRDNSNKVIMAKFQDFVKKNLAGKVMLNKVAGGQDDFYGIIMKDFLAVPIEKGVFVDGTVSPVNGDINAVRDSKGYSADLAKGGDSFSNKEFNVSWSEKIAIGVFTKVGWTTKSGDLGPFPRAEVVKLGAVFQKLVEDRLKEIDDNKIGGSVTDSGKKTNQDGVQWQLITLKFNDNTPGASDESESSIKTTFDVAGKPIKIDYMTKQLAGRGKGAYRHAVWNYPSDPTGTKRMTPQEIMDIIDAQEKVNAARK
ncbi:MAG: hypothetical protein WCP89_00190 [archaeon]